MTVFDKSWKKDEVIGRIFDIVKQKHTVAEHTKNTLLMNHGIKDFCEEARHFAMLPGKSSLFIHYDVATWFENDKFIITIDSIAVYDNFMEYETARMKELHGAKTKNIPNIN